MTKYFKYLYEKNPITSFACTSAGHGLYVGGSDLYDAFKKFHLIEVNARSFFQMQIIKQSDYFRQMRERERNEMYVYWPDIERTEIEHTRFEFEKKTG